MANQLRMWICPHLRPSRKKSIRCSVSVVLRPWFADSGTPLGLRLAASCDFPDRRTQQYHPGSTSTGSTDHLSKHPSTGLPPIDPTTHPETSFGDQDQRAPRAAVHLDCPAGHAHSGQCRRARKGHSLCRRIGRNETARRSGRSRGEDIESAKGRDLTCHQRRSTKRAYRTGFNGGCHPCTGRFWWSGGFNAKVGERSRGRTQECQFAWAFIHEARH